MGHIDVLVKIKLYSSTGIKLKSIAVPISVDSKGSVNFIYDLLGEANIAAYRQKAFCWDVNLTEYSNMDARYWNDKFGAYVSVPFAEHAWNYFSKKGKSVFKFTLKEKSSGTEKQTMTTKTDHHQELKEIRDQLDVLKSMVHDLKVSSSSLSQQGALSGSPSIPRLQEDVGQLKEAFHDILKSVNQLKNKLDGLKNSNTHSEYGTPKIADVTNGSYTNSIDAVKTQGIPTKYMPKPTHDLRNGKDYKSSSLLAPKLSEQVAEVTFNTTTTSRLGSRITEVYQGLTIDPKNVIKQSLLFDSSTDTSIGQLYDALSGNVISGCLFEKIVDSTYEDKTRRPPKISIVRQNDVDGLFEALDIGYDQKVCMLTGAIPMPGPVKIILESKKTVLVLRCVRKKLILMDENRIILAKNVVEALPHASHFSVAIDYGLTAMLSIQETSHQTEDILQKVKHTIEDNKMHVYDTLDHIPVENFIVDFHPKGYSPPKTLKQATLQLVRMAWSEEDFSGPTQLDLMPLASVSKFSHASTVREVSTNLASTFTSNFAKLSTKIEEIDEILAKYKHFEAFLDPVVVTDLIARRSAYEQEEQTQTLRLGNQIQMYRRNKMTEADLEAQIKSTFKNLALKHEDLMASIDKVAMNKLDFIQEFQRKGVACYGRGVALNEVLKNFDSSHVFFGSFDEISKNPRSFSGTNYRLFGRILVQEQTSKKIYVDLDTWARGDRKVQISFYQDSKVIQEDLLALKQSETRQECLARTSETLLEATPTYKTPLVLACPNSISGYCSDEEHKWRCEKCHEIIHYGNDKRLHCNCGSASAFSYEFQCNHWEHGEVFYAFTDFLLLKEKLRHLTLPNEINIMVYGESGVGKSTFVNALTNYFKYASFEEAKSREPTSVISSVFSLIPKVDEVYRINIGKPLSCEEVKLSSIGHSVTQTPTAYVFRIGDKIVRFIDTPGINDTSGDQRDRLNFEKILRYISKYEQIHAVCLLLKPNISRITPNIRHSLNYLLNHLQKSAASNVLFVFTHATQTLFSHGDSYMTLREDIFRNSSIRPENDNTFYVDSDAYRYLWARFRGVNLKTFDESQLEDSWTNSRTQMWRLLEHISKLKPQMVDDMISVAQAKRQIQNLTKPLVDGMVNLQLNQRLISKAVCKLNAVYNGQTKLADTKVYQTEINAKPLHRPRIVCLKCAHVQEDTEIRLKQVVAPKICQDSAFTDDPRTDKNIGSCKVCHCLDSDHARITYDAQITSYPAYEINPASIYRSSPLLYSLIQKLNDHEKDFSKELTITLRNSIDFYAFSKKHQILEAVDFFEEVLKDRISLEKRLDNTSLAQDLDNLYQKYLNEREKMDRLAKSEIQASTEQVDKCKKVIFGLPRMGKKFFEMYNMVDFCEEAEQHQKEEHYQDI